MFVMQLDYCKIVVVGNILGVVVVKDMEPMQVEDLLEVVDLIVVVGGVGLLEVVELVDFVELVVAVQNMEPMQVRDLLVVELAFYYQYQFAEFVAVQNMESKRALVLPLLIVVVE